jgi:hypothetical protein
MRKEKKEKTMPTHPFTEWMGEQEEMINNKE